LLPKIISIQNGFRHSSLTGQQALNAHAESWPARDAQYQLATKQIADGVVERMNKTNTVDACLRTLNFRSEVTQSLLKNIVDYNIKYKLFSQIIKQSS